MIREEHVFKVSKEIENLIIILVCLKIEKVFHLLFPCTSKTQNTIMANESEFETVISEADVEVGVIQNQNEINNQNSAPSQVQSAPVGRFGIFSMSFLQQV